MTTIDHNKTNDIDTQNQNQIQKYKTQSSRDQINDLVVAGFLALFVESIPIMFLFGGIILVTYTLYFIILNIYKPTTNQ